MIGSSGDSSSSLLFALQEALRIIHRAFIVHCALLTGFLQLWTGASSAGGTRAAAGGIKKISSNSGRTRAAAGGIKKISSNSGRTRAAAGGVVFIPPLSSDYAFWG